MEFGKVYYVGADYKDFKRTPGPVNMIIDIVLLDKTQNALKPVLYQLKSNSFIDKNDLIAIKQNFLSLQRDDAFQIIGEVSSVDKKNKRIYLSEQNTVTYTHLIMVSGNKQAIFGSTHDSEFFAGLQALVDALRLRTTASSALSENQRRGKAPKKGKSTQISLADERSDPEKDIEKIAHPTLSQEQNNQASPDLSNNKRLYEVQV